MKFETANQNITWDIRIKCADKNKVMPVVAGLRLYSGVEFVKQRLVNHAILDSGRGDIFFIVTTNFKITNPVQFWQRELNKVTCGDFKKLSDIAEVVYVRHFTRMSQRRCMWGDSDATREDVHRAVDMTAATSC